MALQVSHKLTFILLISTALGSPLENIAQQNFEENFKREFESQLELIENQNVGCLYDKDVCSMDDDCMDDGLFGTCIAQYSDKARFAYRLPAQLRRDLRTILASLLDRNYTWHHRYTQCCVRAALICGSMEIPTDLSVCRHFEKIEQPGQTAERDLNFLSRQEKRLELLQREKYQFQLDIPEKRLPARMASDAEEAELRVADRILDDWKRRQFDEHNLRKIPNSVEEQEIKQDHQKISEPIEKIQTVAEIPVALDDKLEQEPDRAIDDSQERPRVEHPFETELLNMPGETIDSDNELPDYNNKDEDEESQPPPPPPRLPPPKPPQAPPPRRSKVHKTKPHQRIRMHKIQSTHARDRPPSKRQADPTFIDASTLFVRFEKPSSFREKDIAGFIGRLNQLAGGAIVADEFLVNTSSSEVYFKLAPLAKASDIEKIFDNKTTASQLSANGLMKWTSYGFGQPQNRVEVAELGMDSDQQARITSTLLVCGLVLLMIAALFVIFLVQRVRSSKWRLRDLTAPFATGGDADYRDLCRQRMTEKSGEQREPVSAAAQQIASAKPPTGSPNSSTGSWSEDPISTDMDITTGHLILSYMEDYLGNKEKLEQEWAGLCSYEADQSSCAVAAEPENAAKNRYPDLLPYDHSRVILRKDQNATGSDYINASTISDSDPKVKSYILSQGPTDDTASDFWQMVWECGAATIVNLTRLMSSDGNRELCSQYWPSEGSRLFHRFEVHLVSEHIWCEDFVVRNFYIKNFSGGEARTVTMFHYLSWGEDELPPSAKSLLDFRRKVNKSYKGRASPLVIHCNDGCGRTGTYCLLDLALNRINKGVKEIDLAASLEHLRDQRAGLVKTEEQFEFVITAIAEEVHNVLKTLPQ